MGSFPEIEFLSIDDRNKATEYRCGQSDLSIKCILMSVRFYKESKVRNDLKALVLDFKYELRHKGYKKMQMTMSPESSGAMKYETSYLSLLDS